MADKKSNGADTRTRNWSCIIYPDSAPINWRDIINDYHIEWIESPLHDKDINANGEIKKSHWHILLMFSGVKTFEQVREMTDCLNCPSPQKCHNAKALVRYMAHLDNPEKAQYSQSDIKCYGGVDLAEMLKPSSSERYTLIRDMIDYIKSNDIIEFQDLMDYSMIEHFDDWFPLLCDNSAFVIQSYIKSQRHRAEGKMKKCFVNEYTGEIIVKE